MPFPWTKVFLKKSISCIFKSHKNEEMKNQVVAHEMRTQGI